MTQQALADAVGVTRQTVIAIEKGKYSPSLEVAFRMANAPANIDVWNGNNIAMPVSESRVPPRMTSQNRIFCPALNFLDGGWLPFTNMPPPRASHCRSYLFGKFSLIQRTKIITSETMKAKAT